MQHSHSKQQKTKSYLLRIHLKGKLRFDNGSPIDGAMYINLYGKIFGGITANDHFLWFFSKYWWSQTKRFTMALRIHKTLIKKTLHYSAVIRICISSAVMRADTTHYTSWPLSPTTGTCAFYMWPYRTTTPDDFGHKKKNYSWLYILIPTYMLPQDYIHMTLLRQYISIIDNYNLLV